MTLYLEQVFDINDINKNLLNDIDINLDPNILRKSLLT